MIDLIRISIDPSFTIQVNISNWIIILGLLFMLVLLVILRTRGRLGGQELEINEYEIGIGDQKVKIKPNYEDIQVAFKLWVELSTRKIGLPIDYQNDVIVDLYNSWYEFFKLTRELIKDIPISKIRKNSSTQTLVNIAIDVLNKGLRPHLTKWQARFRRWYKAKSEKSDNAVITPQELQQKYPRYDDLIQDMKDVNEKLIKYREILKKIAMQ